MKICITGGKGFLGNALFDALRGVDASVQALGRKDGDLSDAKTADRLLKNADVIVHLAADVGGVGYLRSCAGKAFHTNFQLGLNVVRAACNGKAKRVVMAGTDHFCPANGIDTVTVIPSNLYGPGDNYDSERGHVVAALIRKAMIANFLGEKTFSVWGDGAATRDFVFVRDVACAIAQIAIDDREYCGAVYNLGSGVETSIKEIAYEVASAVGDRIKPRFDIDKPVGYNRRVMSIDYARQSAGYLPETTLQRGLTETVAWLRKEQFVTRWLQSDMQKVA